MIDSPAIDGDRQNGFVGRILRLSESEFFGRKEANPDTWKTIAWWESRRIAYNLLVGAAGLISGAMCLITGLVCEHFVGEPIGIPDPPFLALLAVAAYGFMANLCYTGGWVAELLVQKIWPGKGNDFGRMSFFLGLVFSFLLTLVPGILISAIGALSLLGHFVGK